MASFQDLKAELEQVQAKIQAVNTTGRQTIGRKANQLVGGPQSVTRFIVEKTKQLEAQLQTLQQREFFLREQIQNQMGSDRQTDHNGNQFNLSLLSIPVILGAGVVIFLLVGRKK